MAHSSLSRWIAAAKERLQHLLPREGRRLHVYGVGAGKTGTNSIHGLFATHFRSAHEPEPSQFVRMLESFDQGEIGHEEKVDYLAKKDRRLNLEVESSAMNRRVAGLLAELFPKSKFILTVRDPYTRTDSMLNMLSNLPRPSSWAKSRRDRLFGGSQFRHSPEEKALEEAGLYTLDGLLSDYAKTSKSIEDAIPQDRLLVVRTDQLGESVPAIARFLGIEEDKLDTRKSHQFRTSKKHGFLKNMDPDFVDEKVRTHCSELLEKYFPHISGVRDVMDRL